MQLSKVVLTIVFSIWRFDIVPKKKWIEKDETDVFPHNEG